MMQHALIVHMQSQLTMLQLIEGKHEGRDEAQYSWPQLHAPVTMELLLAQVIIKEAALAHKEDGNEVVTMDT